MDKTNFASLLLMMALGSAACGDDDGGTADAGNDAAAADAATMDATADDAGADDAGDQDSGSADTGPADSGPEDSGPADAGVECFGLSGATADVPFVIPDTFGETTPTWRRPLNECPATELGAEEVPYVAYTYCNDTGATGDFLFEVLATDDDPEILPVIVAYSGTGIPADPLTCGAQNEAFSGFSVVDLTLTLEPDQRVTIVSTAAAPSAGPIQSIASPAEEE